MTHKKAAVCLMLLLLTAALFAGDWVLAAEAFTGDESVGTLMPRLILESIPETLVRSVSRTEQLYRTINSLESQQKKCASDLTKLISQRDAVIFSTTDEETRRKKIGEYEAKIADARATIEENSQRLQRLAECTDYDEAVHLEENIVLYQNKTDALYRVKEGAEPSDIQGLISGSVEVRNGFMFVKANMTFFPGTVVCTEAVAAGTLSDAAEIASEIAATFITQLVNAQPVTLCFSVFPEEAASSVSVLFDGTPVQNPLQPHLFQDGIHTVTVEAPGYASQVFTRDFSDASRYQVSVTLSPLETATLTLSAQDSVPVWIAGRAAGKTPLSVTVNGQTVLGEVQSDTGVVTYFAIDVNGADMARSLTLKTEPSSSRIEKTRKSLYTSYGYLLMSLPFTFYCYGRMNDARTAYSAGRNAGKTVTSYNTWSVISGISTCVSVGLGGYMLWRLYQYMIAADSTLPDRTVPAEESDSSDR